MTGGPGSVTREGGELVLAAPPGMPEATWRSLEQRMVMFLDAREDDAGDMRIDASGSAELQRVLSSWPASSWEWTWSLDARRAAAAAADVAGAVDDLLLTEPTIDPSVPGRLRDSGFTRQLLPAQHAAVSHLMAIGGGGNFSVPGSGKTTMTYAVYALMRAEGIVDRMLVIAPQSAYDAWEEEARDCFEMSPVVELAPAAPRRTSEVLVLNYERAASGANRATIDRWARGHRLLVVFDEAHRAKRGADGLHGRGAQDLTTLAARRLILTGTPMPNGPEDLEAVLDLGWPGQGARLVNPLTRNADRAWVRITKDQLELKPAEITVETVTLDAGHQRIYDALRDSTIAAPTAQNGKAAIMNLIAAASNPMLLGLDARSQLEWPVALPSGLDIEELLDGLPSAVHPAKLLAAANHARSHAEAGTKLVVWTNFLGNVRELTRLLEPYGAAVVTGATPRSDPSAQTDRVRELRRFKEDSGCSVLIATPQTLGEGVSLHHSAQAQLHVDRTFNAGLYLQALDRTHRVGMPDGTTARVTLLVATGTIDERVDESLRAKLIAMDAVLQDPTLRLLASGQNRLSSDLSQEDVRVLLRHLKDERDASATHPRG